MVHIKNNPGQLTELESKTIAEAEWFIYLYGVGLIYLSNSTWDCSDTISAKAYLEELNIPERA